MALKGLYFVPSKIILMYLPQLFQSLRYDFFFQIQHFLIKKSLEFASVCHNVLWFSKVETVEDKTKNRKVPLPLAENLPEMALNLSSNLYEKLNLQQKTFFDTETEFFEKITSISSRLHPRDHSKDQKKKIIKDWLITYNKEIPDCAYLPTNQNCRVVGIVTSSG
mmetsp:Transcript_10055/g.9993  ORF Transcript_10055/g.9993 Transcript_10055/m.9993 type:complete len:165 (-) Transcript_10055:1605-2099(-)